MGTYVLLSTIALAGLIVTLNAQLEAQAKVLQEEEVAALLARICSTNPTDSGGSAADPADVAALWNETLMSRGFRLWLVDQNGEPAVSESRADRGGPSPALIRAAIYGAQRSGSSLRRLPAGPTGHQTVLSARRFRESSSGSPARIALILSDPDADQYSHHLLARAGTRAAVFTWLIGIICAAFIAIGLIGPLRLMTDNLGSEVLRSRRQDVLLQISERRDELGDVANSMMQLEETRQARIEDLQSIENDSRRTVDLLSAVLNAMAEGVIATDKDERVLFLNAAARRLMGISDAIGVGRKFYEVIRVPAVLDAMNEAVATQTLQSLEFRALRDGLYLALVVNPIQRADWSGAVAVFRDISEQRKIESMRRDFVSGVSHELKTPLTVIQACTDTLLEGAVDQPEDARHFLKQINNQSERLLQLVLGMLQLARVESGAEVFQPETCECSGIVAGVLASFQPVAAARSVRLQREGVAELFVVADRQALQTVVSNLVDNAIKHTPEHGSVTVVLSVESNGAAIAVRDTGTGIGREHHSRIFERFYRVDRDRSRERGGTGLGLAIVKHLCQTMKAMVTVRSEPNHGSEFRVLFPIESSANSMVPPHSGR